MTADDRDLPRRLELDIILTPAQIADVKTAYAEHRGEYNTPELEDGSTPRLTDIEAAVNWVIADYFGRTARLADISGYRPSQLAEAQAARSERMHHPAPENVTPLDPWTPRPERDRFGIRPPAKERPRAITEYDVVELDEMNTGALLDLPAYAERPEITVAEWIARKCPRIYTSPAFGCLLKPDPCAICREFHRRKFDFEEFQKSPYRRDV